MHLCNCVMFESHDHGGILPYWYWTYIDMDYFGLSLLGISLCRIPFVLFV
jgi:hypothetical protein